MSRRLRSLTLAALAVAAARGASAQSPPSLPARSAAVLRPGDAVTLRIGSVPDGTEEWEAFLSVDGGLTFPVRITPHLPVVERAFSWVVPPLPTPDARIRLRFGIRGEERELASAQRFAIGFLPGALPLVSSGAALGASPAPGEEDTLAWVERRGGHTFLVVPARARGMASDARWAAAVRPWRAIPRQRTLAPAAGPVAAAPSDAAPGISIRLAPRRRSIASVTRLNV